MDQDGRNRHMVVSRRRPEFRESSSQTHVLNMKQRQYFIRAIRNAQKARNYLLDSPNSLAVPKLNPGLAVHKYPARFHLSVVLQVLSWSESENL